MTVIKGIDAITKLNEVKPQGSKNALKWLKTGDSLVVSIPSTEEIAQAYVHNVYQVFNSCKCTKDDMYDKAVDHLYALANKETNKEKQQELKDQAYQLKAKPKYLFGFHNLETGEPVLIESSKKQGQSLYAIIHEYADELGSYAFKLSKADGGVLSLTPILKGLTPEQKENFEATKGKEIDAELYDNAYFVRDTAGQLEDLKKFGFDISAIVEVPEENNSPEEDEYPEF